MTSKLEKGNTYLGKLPDDARWYIIHQSGQRSWTATVFTHLQAYDTAKDIFITDNGTAMYESFKQGVLTKYRVGSSSQQSLMRADMFHILKFGKLENQ